MSDLGTQPVEIEFRLKNFEAMLKGFERLGDKAVQTQQKMDTQRGRGGSGSRGGGSGGSGNGDSGGSLTRNAAPSAPGRFTQGPNQRLQDYQQQRAVASATGNHAAVSDLDALIAKQQKQITGRQPSTFKDRLKTAIRSTRFNAGGASPLIGRTADLFGEAGGPIALVATAAVAAAIGIFKLSESAANTAREFANLGMSLGSNGRTTGALRGIGGAIGMSSEAVGGASAAFQEKITNDPLAMSVARQMGIFNLSRPYGHVDEGKDLLQAIKGLRAITDMESRIRTARVLSLESVLPATAISDKQFDRAEKTSDRASGIFDADFATKSADFFAGMDNLAKSAENLAGVLAKPIIKDLTDFFNGMSDGIDKITDSMSKHTGNKDWDWLKWIPGATSLDDIRGNADKTGAVDPSVQATVDNTKALKDATAALRPGNYGSTSARGLGISDNMGGEYLRRALEAGGLRLGAF